MTKIPSFSNVFPVGGTNVPQQDGNFFSHNGLARLDPETPTFK